MTAQCNPKQGRQNCTPGGRRSQHAGRPALGSAAAPQECGRGVLCQEGYEHRCMALWAKRATSAKCHRTITRTRHPWKAIMGGAEGEAAHDNGVGSIDGAEHPHHAHHPNEALPLVHMSAMAQGMPRARWHTRLASEPCREPARSTNGNREYERTIFE